jgi:hypothetical protein
MNNKEAATHISKDRNTMIITIAKDAKTSVQNDEISAMVQKIKSSLRKEDVLVTISSV